MHPKPDHTLLTFAVLYGLQLLGNRYQMHKPLDPHEAKVWALPKIQRRRQFVFEKTRIPHAGNHMLLPAVQASGKLDVMTAMPSRSWVAIWEDLCERSGLNAQNPTGCFSSHSLRQGGAQWRYNYAPVGSRWGLPIIRWWGGWANGEGVSNRTI